MWQDWHLVPPPRRCVPAPQCFQRGGGVDALEASRGKFPEWKASRATPVLGPTAEPEAQAAMAGQGLGRPWCYPGIWEAMADQGAWAAMADTGTLAAMAETASEAVALAPTPGSTAGGPSPHPPPKKTNFPEKSSGSIGHFGELWESGHLGALWRSGHLWVRSRSGLWHWRALWLESAAATGLERATDTRLGRAADGCINSPRPAGLGEQGDVGVNFPVDGATLGARKRRSKETRNSSTNRLLMEHKQDHRERRRPD